MICHVKGLSYIDKHSYYRGFILIYDVRVQIIYMILQMDMQ